MTEKEQELTIRCEKYALMLGFVVGGISVILQDFNNNNHKEGKTKLDELFDKMLQELDNEFYIKGKL